MNKTRLFACLLAFTLPLAHANDTDTRLRRLETEVIRLQERVNMLERMLQRERSGADNHMYVCRINAYTQIYEGESTNVGAAKRQVQTACLKEQPDLLCRTQNIRCIRY